MSNEFVLDLIASLKQAESKKQVNADIRQLEQAIHMLKLTATLTKGDTKKEINSYIKELSGKLSYIKLKGKIDDKNLKREIDKSLHHMTFKEIDALNIDGNKAKLKLRKAIADMKTYAEKMPIHVNVSVKKEKLSNDLTTFLNKNSKIRESSILLAESEKIRELIESVDDKGTLRNATDAFSLFKSEVISTGYAGKSTSQKIKDMLGHITKIGSFFGVASLAVNNFRKSLSTLRSNDTILTEISKTSEMTKKQLKELGDEAFKVASKYGQLSGNYLLGVQEMARSGYESLSKELAELSLLAQSAGDMTAENANNYILATDAAYKYGGSVEKLNAALDGANYISNKNSASLTDISDAIRVSASFAANAEVTIGELTAAEATMIATTKRSGSEMGRAFRSIILNLQQVSGEFDGEIIDEEQLKKVEARCHSLGVELEYVKDGVATLRNPMEVLKDLAKVYNSLPDNSADKQGLISDIGGKYHANALSSLLSRWDLYEKMLSEFSQGTGSALEEAEKTADSWEGRIAKLQNSWDSFINTLTNKEAIKGSISFFDRLIQGAETLTNAIGEIPVVLTALNSALVMTNKDYGITQIWNKDKGKIDLQGNIFGIDITNIKNMKKHFAEAEGVILQWNDKLKAGKTDLDAFGNSLVQNNAQFKAYLSTCSKDAPASLEGYKSYLKSAGVETDALRLKTVLLNAAISMGVGIALQLAMKGITLLAEKMSDLVHESEKCKERVDELMSSYRSAIDKANSNAKTIEELASRYEELSKGVNNLGGTYLLTTEETKEYHDICNKIAEMFPTLVQGYTNEGNAILSLKGNVEELRDAYKEAQLEAYNMLIVSGKDSDGNDIIKNWENLHNTDFFSKLLDIGGAEVGGDISVNEALAQLKALSEMSAETYRNIEKVTGSGSRKEIAALSDIERLIGYGSYIPTTLGIDASVSDKDFESARKQAKALIQTYQAEIDSALKNVQTLANAYLMTNEDYAKLDDQSKTAASIIVNSINEGIASGFEDKADVGEYVVGIVDTIKGNPDVQDALVSLFSLDLSDMPVNEARDLIDLYIKSIAEAIEEDELELRVRLGFDDTVDTANKLRNSIRQITDDHGITDRSEYAYLMGEVDFDSFTQAQVELWLEATRGAENASQAIEMYKTKLAEINANADSVSFSDIFSFKDGDTITNLGKISESIDTIQNAYKALSDAIDEYNEEGAFSIDTLQSVISLGDDWLDYLVDEEGKLKLDKESLEQLTLSRLNDMRVQAINNLIDNVSKINNDASATEYLTTTNYALADSYEAVGKASLETARMQMQAAVAAGTLSQENMDAAMSKAYADVEKINKLFDNTDLSAKSIRGGSGNSKSSKSEFDETVDFFERRIRILDEALSRLKTSLENVSGSFGKNNLIDAELNITGEKFRNYTDALSMYTQKANETLSKLPADIAAKVKDGAVALTDFVGDGNKDVVEAIKDYESWAGKVNDCKQELAELRTTIRQLELEKFNNIVSDFTDQFDLRNNSKELISKQIDLLKESGQLIGESFFTAQIDQSKKQLELLENEKAQLINQMTDSVSSGRVAKGTTEWLEMVNALSDVDGSILDCKKSIEEFDNELLSIHTEVFNRIQTQFSNLHSEISNIIDLFDEFDVSDDKGIWSKEAIAQLGLLSQQYELAEYQIQQYSNEIDELNKQYLAGRYSATEYADKLATLNSAQWDSVKSSESAKDAILDLNEARVENQIKGIEKEVESYKELTQSQIDALEASRDLHEYENSIAEKTKSITDLERQIAAMQNDNSAAAIAKRKRLEQQLSEAKKDLEEAEYQHSVDTQKEALETQREEYEKKRNEEIEALRESLNDKEAILSSSFETVKNNASLIGQEIATIATEHGITVSNSLISSWQSGETAIASYGEILSQKTSAFIGNVIGVENEVWNLQTQANQTSESLAWMFSTKADNLVNELATSYYSEMNLQLMTQSLRDSLVNTLESGYDVSKIVDALNSIKTAADSAGESVRRVGDEGASMDSIKRSGAGGGGGGRAAMHTMAYAGGTRSSEGNIIVTDEDGYEIKLPKLSSGKYTIANEGTQIFTKEQTDNLFKWSKLDPAPSLVNRRSTDEQMAELWRMTRMPEIIPNNGARNSQNIHYDSMFRIEGDVIDADRIIKRMEKAAIKIADQRIDKSWRDVGDEMSFEEYESATHHR